MIAWTWILCQHLLQGFQLLCRQLSFQILRYVYRQGIPAFTVNKSAFRLRVAVGVGYVGFDVVDGCSVHEIGSKYMDNRSPVACHLYSVYANRRESQTVGTEGRPRGKYTHSLVATQTGRPDGERHVLSAIRKNRLAELPDNPQIVKLLKSPDGFLVSEFRGKDDVA